MAERSTDIFKARSILDSGGIVAIPTETVYGLAGNALNEDAIISIYKAKNRPSFDPLIAHVSSIKQVESITNDIPEIAYKLAEKFWPGPLTMLLTKADHVPDILTSGLPRVAVRMPNHPLTLQLLESIDYPLAAPSANPFGYVSPTSADHVNDQMGDIIDLILDGGKTKIGVESTIVSFESEKIIVNRIGGLSIEKLEEFGPVSMNINQSSNPSAPGMLKSHYAPGKKVIIGNIDSLLDVYKERVGVLSFQKKYQNLPNQVLSSSGNLDEAANKLFSALRLLDKEDIDIIVTEKFPETGLGRAINDRLGRAAANN